MARTDNTPEEGNNRAQGNSWAKDKKVFTRSDRFDRPSEGGGRSEGGRRGENRDRSNYIPENREGRSGDSRREGQARDFGNSRGGDRPQRRDSDNNRGERPQRREFNSDSRGERPARREFDNNRGERPQRREFNGNREDRPQRREFDTTRGERPARREFDSNKGEGFRPNRNTDRPSSRPTSEGGRERRPERGEDRGFSRGGERREGGNSERGRGREHSDDRRAGARPRSEDRGGFRKPGSSPEREGNRFNRPDSRDERSTPRENDSFSGKETENRESRGGYGREERRSYNDRPAPRDARGGRGNDRFSDRKGSRPERTERDEKPTNSREGRFNRSSEEEVKEAPSYNLKRYEERKKRKEPETGNEDLRLNRYIANAGICSRREADELIAAGEIKVNGEVVTEMGYKVGPTDSVTYGRKKLNREKTVYVLLNKPKDFITTTEDPEGRKTVMDLVKNASKERLFPVGRLDRNTTGLLMFTNDGELAQKLTHPSNKVTKIYQVELDKPITREDFIKVQEGVELEDGKAIVDDVAIIGNNNQFLGLEIHIGRNRIVRRIFEHLGYEVVTLDRVQYAGLTKKDLPRGNWRFLSEKEVVRLKYFM